ncbi:hypothetical protein B5X24_HaOG207073 [Helicoverpa armigera]|uniref:Uncharacterized protein n=1 Tax=Helicoverpa armigera TaxID=29058 RepID=A0A2W1BPS7_HELAM|nr:hypothetical protein B5X24_HaOG207073 [Helicoverpa armigera]
MASVYDDTDEADQVDEKATEKQNVEHLDDNTGEVEPQEEFPKNSTGSNVEEFIASAVKPECSASLGRIANL